MKIIITTPVGTITSVGVNAQEYDDLEKGYLGVMAGNWDAAVLAIETEAGVSHIPSGLLKQSIFTKIESNE